MAIMRSGGRWERFAGVRTFCLPSSRYFSLSRKHGGEFLLGMRCTNMPDYMAHYIFIVMLIVLITCPCNCCAFCTILSWSSLLNPRPFSDFPGRSVREAINRDTDSNLSRHRYRVLKRAADDWLIFFRQLSERIWLSYAKSRNLGERLRARQSLGADRLSRGPGNCGDLQRQALPSNVPHVLPVY